MDMNEILAFLVDGLEHVFRQYRFQFIQISVAPESEHVESEGDEGVVALSMHLFAQKMHEFVLPQPDFIHIGGDVTYLALRPYLVEIHGENARELFHLLIIRCDVGVQNLGDFTLEKVGVAQEDAAQFEVDNQRGEQFFQRCLRIFDELQPHTDVLDMVFVDRQLPVFVHKHVARRDESELDEPFLEMVHYLLHLGGVDVDDFLTQCELEIKHRRGVVFAQFLCEVENSVDEWYQLVLRQLVDGVAHHAVHVPYQTLALALHARKMQQEKHIMELRDEPREQLLRLGETLRNLFKMRHNR